MAYKFYTDTYLYKKIPTDGSADPKSIVNIEYLDKRHESESSDLIQLIFKNQEIINNKIDLSFNLSSKHYLIDIFDKDDLRLYPLYENKKKNGVTLRFYNLNSEFVTVVITGKRVKET